MQVTEIRPDVEALTAQATEKREHWESLVQKLDNARSRLSSSGLVDQSVLVKLRREVTELPDQILMAELAYRRAEIERVDAEAAVVAEEFRVYRMSGAVLDAEKKMQVAQDDLRAAQKKGHVLESRAKNKREQRQRLNARLAELEAEARGQRDLDLAPVVRSLQHGFRAIRNTVGA